MNLTVGLIWRNIVFEVGEDMQVEEKIELLQSINSDTVLNTDMFYQVLGKCGDLKNYYYDSMITNPINCEKELSRLSDANYDLCCNLLTMLLREDYFSNGSFVERQREGQVKPIVERMISLLKKEENKITKFSEKTLDSLNGFYVYALVDPRNDSVFYVGKGTGDRVFSHEIESNKSVKAEKKKLKKIQEIENCGFSVKRIIVNWGLTEEEAFAAEAALINLVNCFSDIQLTNEVSGHHAHEAMTVEDFELKYGAVPLKKEDIKHSIIVIKINKLYRKNMTDEELYDVVRGYWVASLKTIKTKKVEYVFGVYNGLIVAVYKPDEWHYIHEKIDLPQHGMLTEQDYERLKGRVYFVCKDYKNLDEEGVAYLHKSLDELKENKSAQNPITYLIPDAL